MTKKRSKSNRELAEVRKQEAENGKKYWDISHYVIPAQPTPYPFPWMHPDYVEKKVEYVPRKREQAD